MDPPPTATAEAESAADKERLNVAALRANRMLLDYLRSKGYKRAEKALLKESNDTNPDDASKAISTRLDQTDEELRNVILLINSQPPYHYRSATGVGQASSVELEAQQMEMAYNELRDWVDHSLDLYKNELHAILYPVFVHIYLEMIRRGYIMESRSFLQRVGIEFRSTSAGTGGGMAAMVHQQQSQRQKELNALAGLSNPQHFGENEVASIFLKNRYEIFLSPYAFELLIGFITDDKDRMILLRILNQRCRVRLDTAGTLRPWSTQGDALPAAIAVHGQGMQGGFLNTVEQEALRDTRPVLWGRLKPIQYIVPDYAEEIVKPVGEDEEQKVLTDQERYFVEPDGTISESQVPLPKYRLGSLGLETANDFKHRHTLSSASLPSAFFYTFANTVGNSLHALAMSPDASSIVAGFQDSSVRVWDCKSGTCVTCIGHQGPVYSVSVSPDARYFLSSSEDGSVRLWSQALKTDLVAYRGHNYPVWCVAFSPLGYYFVSGGHDRSARLWSTDHIYPLRIFAGHLSDVDCIAWHPNCNYVATGSSDCSARLWDIRTGDCVRIFGLQDGPISCLAISPDGSRIAIGGESCLIEEWDLSSGRKMQTMKGHTNSIWSLSYSCEGSLIASGGADCTVRLWNSASSPVERAQNIDLAAVVEASSGSNVRVQKPLRTFGTKQTPVQMTQFTRKNLLIAGGAYMQGDDNRRP